MSDFIDLSFPNAGVDTSVGFNRQPNRNTPDGYYRTAVDALNVRATDPQTGRMRGGSRPGIVKHIEGQISGTNPVQWLGSVVVTEGLVPGSGTAVSTYAGFLAKSTSGFVLGTYNSADGFKLDADAALEYYGGYQHLSVGARAFVSGGSNPSYTALDIADGSGVTVAVAVVSESSTAKYVTVVNGRRYATTLTAVPGTGVDAGTCSVCNDSSYHLIVGVLTGNSRLVASAVNDENTVVWSNLNVVTTSEFLPSGSTTFVFGTACCVSGTYLIVNAPGSTGIIRCLAADGTSGSVLVTKAQIATNAGTGYEQFRSEDWGETIAVAGGVIAVPIRGRTTNVEYGGLCFITASSGAFTYSALTGLEAGATVTTSESRNGLSVKVTTDGTDFYLLIAPLAANSNGTWAAPVVRKVSGAAGTVTWTTTLDGAGYLAPSLSLRHFSGLDLLEVSGIPYAVSLNVTTGAVSGGGVISSGAVSAATDAGSLTPGAETVDSGSATGPQDVLLGASAGTLKVAYGGAWRSVTGGTSLMSSSAKVIRGVSAYQRVYFTDSAGYFEYIPSSNTAQAWAAVTGTLPVDAAGRPGRLIALWNGRLVISALPGDNRNWFMSAQGDPYDWLYGATPQFQTEAIAGNSSPLGRVGDVVTALIPHTDQTLIFGCADSIWWLRGDPWNGGELSPATNGIGIAFGDAWCMDPFGVVYFMSHNRRIFRMVPGERPVSVSQSIDNNLKGVNLQAVTITMEWEDEEQGISVFITPTASAQATEHWFWEQQSGGWFPVEFGSVNHSPLCCHTFKGNSANERAVLFGSWDGYARRFSVEATTDDGTAFESSVTIGPILTKESLDVKFLSLQGILGADSGAVTYEVYVGRTAETALRADPVATGTLGAGRGKTKEVKRSGHACYLRLSSSNRWAMETIKVYVSDLGRIRGRN